jgi:hypothetical protein
MWRMQEDRNTDTRQKKVARHLYSNLLQAVATDNRKWDRYLGLPLIRGRRVVSYPRSAASSAVADAGIFLSL